MDLGKTGNEQPMEGRAAFSAHGVLSGPCFALGTLWANVAWKDPERNAVGVVVICFAVGILWAIWLRGFRIRLTTDQLEYRDGFYRWVRIPRKAIKQAELRWIECRLGRRLRIPRLVIAYGLGQNVLAINTKPFRRRELSELNQWLSRS